jgi:hypothetical protein
MGRETRKSAWTLAQIGFKQPEDVEFSDLQPHIRKAVTVAEWLNQNGLVCDKLSVGALQNLLIADAQVAGHALLARYDETHQSPLVFAPKVIRKVAVELLLQGRELRADALDEMCRYVSRGGRLAEYPSLTTVWNFVAVRGGWGEDRDKALLKRFGNEWFRCSLRNRDRMRWQYDIDVSNESCQASLLWEWGVLEYLWLRAGDSER